MIRQLDFGFESHGNKSFVTYRITDWDRMDPVEIEMMRRNKIEGLLPFNIMQSDEQILCCYDITSMANLGFTLQRRLNRRQLLQILEKLARGMENAEDYMLDSSHFVLNPEYIYTTLGELDIQLMLIPCLSEDVTEQIDLNDFLRNLISGISFDYSQGGGDFYAQILNYINSGKKVTPRGLRETLYQFMDGGKLQKEGGTLRTAGEEAETSSAANNEEFFQRKRSLDSRAVKQEGKQQGSKESLQVQQGTAFQMPFQQPRKEALNPPAREQREKGKKGFLKKEKKQKLRMNPDIEVPGIAIPGTDDISIKIPDSPPASLEQPGQDVKKEISAPPAESKRKKHSLFHKRADHAAGNAEASAHVNGPVPKAIPKSFALQGITDPNHQMPAGPAPEEYPAAALQQNGAMAGNDPADRGKPDAGGKSAGTGQVNSYAAAGEIAGTVMIENTGEEKPFLENAKTGERIYLTRESFRLGRHPDYVDYVVGNPTVGRIHATIVQRKGRYYVMDVNSQNGTFVDKKRIPSNIEVEITDGCQVQLGTEHYYFYTR